MYYASLALANVIVIALSMILALVLPFFARMEEGPCDNANATATEPRLPKWLAWFQTPDNSLWGDKGWRTIHCATQYSTRWGMTKWLWRNHAYGFAWSVLAAPLDMSTMLLMCGDPAIGHKTKPGSFFIRMGKYWQWKYVGEAFGWHCYTAAAFPALLSVAAFFADLSLWIVALPVVLTVVTLIVGVDIQLGGKRRCWLINLGWLLDTYWVSPSEAKPGVKALFMLSPRLKGYEPQ